ncbi:winged helix-turn-helix transcriptional regulator [Antrihabitans cavernicola]|uniref:Helix-turn-helix transcriptional regulator n=1 Tax=Antrihabitans cavernicola TaxID=2495913 RepID=A0A5A7SAB7_9NOCA|nr:helix-turn-helix domain-containing protein [Spelaeibacter cavernicola]KAA0022239.1 helix-turn-helix transcriptional regulator [Spelaeibacter cavernicola]
MEEPTPEDDTALAFSVFGSACTSRQALQNVTGRWGVLAIAALSDGPYRFNALRRRVEGVSERMLSQTLQALERDGMVDRAVLEAIPPKVEYSLTELGTEVAVALRALIDVVEAGMPTVTAAQEEYDCNRA